MALKDVARAAFQPARLPPGMEPGFYEHATYAPTLNTFPNGCHVCEVEIDPDTGEVALQSYLVVDDVGTVINPLTLAGQIHGGVAQGVGQILMEQVVYEPGSGQLLTASFMDYCMPRADDMCSMRIVSNPVPTEGNPLGAKGAGEAGMRRRAAGGDERDHACAGAARRARARHAGHQRSHLARDPRREGGVGAALRTGAEYREALRDGRKVWVIGEGAVEDVTTHPATRAMVDEYVAWYDRHFDPAWQDILLNGEGAALGLRAAEELPMISSAWAAVSRRRRSSAPATSRIRRPMGI